MALTNEQYDILMRDYDHKRQRARALREIRYQEVVRSSPAFADLDAEAADLAGAFTARLSESAAIDIDAMKADFAAASARRQAILEEAGFPADYLETVFECPDCRDTGFIGAEKCHCFRQRELALAYEQSHLSALAEDMDFSMLREDCYQNGNAAENTDNFRRARDTALTFVEHFPHNEKNLLFMGNVGTGKTTLCVCIAKELLSRRYDVLYFSAVSLFEHLAQAHFSKNRGEDSTEVFSDLFTCDLLVIDDLGSELTNSFVEEQLFTLLNERSIRRRAIVLSTNLTIDDLRRLYGDRVFSRIISGFTARKLTGNDIRSLQ